VNNDNHLLCSTEKTIINRFHVELKNESLKISFIGEISLANKFKKKTFKLIAPKETLSC